MVSARCIAFVGVIAVLLTTLTGCGAANPNTVSSPPETGVSPATEMRGVWVSYLDLEPVLANATPATAAQRLDTLLDTCRNSGFNTVFWHVRSHSNAFYQSTVYPAADAADALLQQGFDPLAYAVKAAHDRQLALHAWLNPYRIGETVANAPLTESEQRFQKGGVWYYNPAHPQVQKLVLDGVREILTHYAVDGIHIDDYFYPDGMNAAGELFEDIPTGMSVTTYRQTQVNMLVSSIHALARGHGCVFGVSPMATIKRCQTTAYADVPLWLTTPGYVDYICPQIYSGFAHETRPFTQVLNEWLALPRRADVGLYIGLALYKAGLTEDTYAGTGRLEWSTHTDIIARQLDAIRKTGQIDGFIVFRYKQLIDTTPAVQAERQALLQRLL